MFGRSAYVSSVSLTIPRGFWVILPKRSQRIKANPSSQDGDDNVYATFEHPNPNFAHVLFLALEKFARKPQILTALLDMGYSPNQSKMRELDPAVGMEVDPILCWALAQGENKISSISIENLIDRGGEKLNNVSLTITDRY